MKAVCIGGATVDAIATIESSHIERMSLLNAETAYLLLEEGRKTEALDISTHCGGGALNAAVALARLGFDTSALVKLGRDARAEFICGRLAAEGVSRRWIVDDAHVPTGASMIIASHERNAAVFTFRGANALLDPADLADEAFTTDLVYVSGLSGKSAECFPHIVSKAAAAGALVAVNAGARQLAVHAETFIDNLSRIYILALNRREAEILLPHLVARTGDRRGSPPRVTAGECPPALLARGLSGAGCEMSLPTFLATLHRLGARYVMLTDGGGGAYVAAENQIVYCPAEETHVAGTAGAGDAMAATFAAFITLGHFADVALEAATLNAASVVSYIDTQSGLLRREVLDERLAVLADRRLRKWRL